MKKLLLTVFAIGALASCKKDYYLNDLNDANAQIELLQSKVASLSTKLETKISENNANALVISGLSSDIIDLSIEIENYDISNLTLLLDNDLLSQNISNLNDRIEALHFDLADLLAADDLDVEAIAVLTETIRVLEGQTTASVIEYIESVTVIVNTDIVTTVDTDAIARLNAIIADLRAQLANLPDTTDDYVDPIPTPVDPIVPIDTDTATDTTDDNTPDPSPDANDPLDILSDWSAYGPDFVTSSHVATFTQQSTRTIIVVGTPDANPPVGDLIRTRVIDNPNYVEGSGADDLNVESDFTHAALLVSPEFTSYNVGDTAYAVAGYYSTREEQISAIENRVHQQGANQNSTEYTIIEVDVYQVRESAASGDVNNDGVINSGTAINQIVVTISGAGAVPAIVGLHRATDEHYYYTAQ